MDDQKHRNILENRDMPMIHLVYEIPLTEADPIPYLF